MKLNKSVPALLVMAGFTGAMLLLVAIGLVRNYSPVPFWDMWDGYLNFYLAVTDGDLSAWVRQQNEHRIVLSHLLFWLDLRYFGGASWFLLMVNYALAAATALLFWRLLRARLTPQLRSPAETVLGLFLVAWLFSWMQQENFTWAFQSQFFLAQLLPLWSLYCLYLSLSLAGGTNWFVLACAGGVAAAGSMANGVLALPLLLCYTVLTQQGWRRCGVLALLTIATLGAFFYGYHQPSDHIPFLTVLHDSAVPLLRYMLQYLGSPWYFLAGSSVAGKQLALLGGIVLVVLCVLQGLRWYQRRDDTLLLALLLFLAYVVATATATASGRLHVGDGEPFSSRYTTPALMAWAAMLVLYAPRWLAAARAGRRVLLALPLMVLTVALLVLQTNALHPQTALLYQKKIAALALELGVADQVQVGNVYPLARNVLPIAELARARHESVFGMAPWRGLHDAIGRPETINNPRSPCQGSLDEVAPVESDANYLRVSGWLRKRDGGLMGETLRLVDGNGKLVGVALSGHEQPDAATSVDKNARYVEFQGYVLASIAGSALSLQADTASGGCALTVQIPLTLVTLTSQAPDASISSLLAASAVVQGPNWTGSDYEHTEIPGLRVYGSFVQADADIGTISLRVKRGDRLFYRSGPGGGRQRLSFPGTTLEEVRLPVRTEWTLLEFRGSALPDGEFVVTFSDAGDGWGEWSAIALAR